jgi:cytoskeleton protein RodZ
MTSFSEKAEDFEPGFQHISPASSEHGSQTISAGAMLRQFRESAGLHIAALAVALKVPVKKLEALEADRYDLLPDVVFARALASSVCRNLKVDATPVLALLPQSSMQLYRQGATPENASFTAYSSSAKHLNRASVSGPAMLAGCVLVLATAIVVFLPSIKTFSQLFTFDFVTIGGSKTNPNDAGELRSDLTINRVDPLVPSTQPDTNAGSPLTLLPSLQTAAATQSSSEPVMPPPSNGAATSVVGLDSPAAKPVDRLITFSAEAKSSWIEVTDAKGAVVLSRTLGAGEIVSTSGSLPLTVVVGRADVTRVQVRGQSFDLAAHSRDNVARFEVK